MVKAHFIAKRSVARRGHPRTTADCSGHGAYLRGTEDGKWGDDLCRTSKCYGGLLRGRGGLFRCDELALRAVGCYGQSCPQANRSGMGWTRPVLTLLGEIALPFDHPPFC